MKITCLHCGAAYECGAEYFGKSFQCSACGTEVFVPAPAPQTTSMPQFTPPPPPESAAVADDGDDPGERRTIYGVLTSVFAMLGAIAFAACFAVGLFFLGAKLFGSGAEEPVGKPVLHLSDIDRAEAEFDAQMRRLAEAREQTQAIVFSFGGCIFIVLVFPPVLANLRRTDIALRTSGIKPFFYF